jgi:hypothetical protein
LIADTDLVAKRTGTKVSAQWSNDEVVHQVLVDLLNAEENSETAVELLKQVLGRSNETENRKQLRSYDSRRTNPLRRMT